MMEAQFEAMEGRLEELAVATAQPEIIQDVPRWQEMLKELQTRLDRKDYEAGKQYYHMEDYLSARVKLKNVLKTNSDNVYREDVLYYTAMASYHYARLSVKEKQKERYLVFTDDYLNFISEYPESHYRPELDRLYRQVNEK